MPQQAQKDKLWATRMYVPLRGVDYIYYVIVRSFVKYELNVVDRHLC